MVSAIIELGIGYFLTYKVPGILNLPKPPSMAVKIVGIILLILGFISLVQSIGVILHIN